MQGRSIAIVGTVGVPANYGGFETLAENLVKYHDAASLPDPMTVYCSSRSYPSKQPAFLSARLKYVPLNANGAQSIPYDVVSLISAVWNRSEVILLLGVSGAVGLPLVRLFSSARIVTNIDGIEWRREKWQGWAKRFLRFSEKIAVRFSHEVIADNAAIAEYVAKTYGVDSRVIAYGGDHAEAVSEVALSEYALPGSYAFSVCRIEPENNVHMVLEAYSGLKSRNLVMVGNWNNSEYGRRLREQYAACGNIFMFDPIYDSGKLKYLRSRASFYIHGHSAGGTNPALVEAMHFGKAVLAFDCNYNRSTTEDKALFFGNSAELVRLIETTKAEEFARVGRDVAEIAGRRYTWTIVARQYFALLGA
jgi:glycosyltransferase involved in cell wall biosynthesis